MSCSGALFEPELIEEPQGNIVFAGEKRVWHLRSSSLQSGSRGCISLRGWVASRVSSDTPLVMIFLSSMWSFLGDGIVRFVVPPS